MSKQKLLALIKIGKVDDIKTLIDQNIDYVAMILDGQKSLIHYAAEYGYLELIQFLLEKKPDLLNLTDNNVQTPILIAISNGHASVANYFARKLSELSFDTILDHFKLFVTPHVIPSEARDLPAVAQSLT